MLPTSSALCRFARDNQLLVAVRGGGHNIAGNAVCDGGLMIDLSPMTSVRVDTAAKRAWVEPGATLADVDSETQSFGLAVPTGINSTTGIAGLTLGGGFGWITRKFGLTIDSLVSADVVTADGSLVRASETQNSDLFWALRGGGGNFGIVTAFEFRLHDVGLQVTAGLVVHPFGDAKTVLEQYRQALETAPDELTCWVVMRQAPPLPFLPAEWHGREVLILAMCYCGDAASADAATAKLRSIGKPIADVVGPTPFAGWQQAFDPLLTPGARNYWKSHDFTELSDAAIDILVGAAGNLPGPECEIFIAHVGGAAGPHRGRCDGLSATQFAFRHERACPLARPGMDAACIGWARRSSRLQNPILRERPISTSCRKTRVIASPAPMAANYQRLGEIKRRYDPGNLFRMNQNVKPKGEAG